jgi:hypothetical protein
VSAADSLLLERNPIGGNANDSNPGEERLGLLLFIEMMLITIGEDDA